MTQALTTFFDAWSETDAGKRTQAIEASVASDGHYSDPRSGERLSSIEAISKYVGMFSAGAPGWTAKVVKSDEVNGYVRAVVAFGAKARTAPMLFSTAPISATSTARASLHFFRGLSASQTLSNVKKTNVVEHD